MTDKRPFEEMNTIAKQIKEQALVATDDYLKVPQEDHLVSSCERFASW